MKEELNFAETNIPEPIFTITQKDIEQMKSKQTSVDWLIEKYYKSEGNLTVDDLDQAQEMHKQETMDAWEDGYDSFSTRNAEQYYKETFNVEAT